MTLKWEEFLDKVYGCWIGKCVSGTIGAPYEGYKGTMNVQYTPKMIEDMRPNDDLDLQILWLDVIEKKGPNFTSKDLAEAFYNQCDYSPGEYATFRKNYELGIMPPLSGKFNNNYYIEGMGCPIRSEIWACMAPGDPNLAVSLASMDGCLDHYGESIIAEQYLAALESLAFTDKWSLKDLITRSLEYIDENSKVYDLVNKVIDWCQQSSDWRYIYGRIIRDYGHPDCTNMYQNIGITIMALLLGNGHLINTTMLALNCGFDTDCTCATVGSVIGIIEGGKKMMKDYSLSEQTYKLGVRSDRRSDKVYDLAEDTAYAALFFADRNKKVDIKGYPEDKMPVIEGKIAFPIDFRVEYNDGIPAIAPGESKNITIYLDTNTKIKASGLIKFSAPEGFTVKPQEKKFRMGLFNTGIEITVSVAKDIPKLMNKNIINATITLDNEDIFKESFGLAGATLWKVYGPFWENTTFVAPPEANESYYNGLGGCTTKDESSTKIRQFHLNMKADWEKEYLEEYLLGNGELPNEAEYDPAYQGFPVYLYEDRFSFNNLFNFAGPCVAYMVRDIYVAEDMNVCMQIGHSDIFRVWKDGELLAYSDKTENWTPENIHKHYIPLKSGMNRFVLKLVRTNGTSTFSIMFTKNGACTQMITDLGSGKV